MFDFPPHVFSRAADAKNNLVGVTIEADGHADYTQLANAFKSYSLAIGYSESTIRRGFNLDEDVDLFE